MKYTRTKCRKIFLGGIACLSISSIFLSNNIYGKNSNNVVGIYNNVFKNSYIHKDKIKILDKEVKKNKKKFLSRKLKNVNIINFSDKRNTFIYFYDKSSRKFVYKLKLNKSNLKIRIPNGNYELIVITEKNNGFIGQSTSLKINKSTKKINIANKKFEVLSVNGLDDKINTKEKNKINKDKEYKNTNTNDKEDNGNISNTEIYALNTDVIINKENKNKQNNKSYFIIKNNELTGVTSDGKQYIKENQGSITLPDNIKIIGKSSLNNLGIRDIVIPSTVVKIEEKALDNNNLKEVNLKNNKCIVEKGIFGNKRFVNIITANRNNKDSISENNFGSLVNRASVNVNYREQNGGIYKSKELVGNNLSDRTSYNIADYYKIGDTVTVKPRESGYAEQLPKSINLKDNNSVDFTYRGDEIINKIENVHDKDPQILGVRDRYFIKGEIYSPNLDLLKGIKAFDYKGQSITNNILIKNTDNININKAGDYKVTYEVKDSEGRSIDKTATIHVEGERKFYNYDFIYDGNIVMGLSRSGIHKIADVFLKSEEKVLNLPEKSPNGTVITEIGSLAFKADGFRKVIIPDSYKKIGIKAFYANNLEELNLPDSIIELGEGAFDINNLKSVVIPNSITSIPKRCFAANNLEEITIPSTVKYIGKEAFMANPYQKEGKNAESWVKELTIPSSVKEIDSLAFSFCHITSLKLNEGIEKIQQGAFSKNYITRVDIPNSLKFISGDAFLENSASKKTPNVAVKLYTKDGKNPNKIKSSISFTVDDGKHESHNWEETDFIYEDATGLNLSKKGSENIRYNKELVIPEKVNNKTVEKISENAFLYKNIVSIKMPDTIKYIGNLSFAGNKIESLILPSSCISIGENSFFDNPISTLKLNDKLEKIGKNAFYNNELSEISLPDSINVIEDGAFKKKSPIDKVKLNITFNPKTKSFIESNRSRKDFILNVVGELGGDELTLFNPNDLDKTYGINGSIALVLNKPETLNSLDNIKLKLNNQEIEFEKKYSYSKPAIIIEGNKLKITGLEKKYDKTLDKQNLNIETPDKSYNISFKVYIPERISLDGEKINLTEPQDYSQGLKLYLPNNKMPYDGLNVKDNNSNIKFSFDKESGIITIDKEIIEGKKTRDNYIEIVLSAKYYKMNYFKIPLKEDSEENNSDNSILKGDGVATDNEDGTYTYSFKVNDSEMYENLKDDTDGIKLEIGRTKYEYSDYPSMDEFKVDFEEPDIVNFTISNIDGHNFDTIVISYYDKKLLEKTINDNNLED